MLRSICLSARTAWGCELALREGLRPVSPSCDLTTVCVQIRAAGQRTFNVCYFLGIASWEARARSCQDHVECAILELGRRTITRIDSVEKSQWLGMRDVCQLRVESRMAA